MIVYDLSTKQIETYVQMCIILTSPLLICFSRNVRLEGELTSVKASHDSQFVLINHAPDVSLFSQSLFSSDT